MYAIIISKQKYAIVFICFIFCMKQALPRYTLAHERAVYKTVAVVADTKKIVQTLDVTSLGELRAMHKPDVDIEDLLAAIIMICKKFQNFSHNR